MGRTRSERANHASRLGTALVAALAAGMCLASASARADSGSGNGDGGELAAAQQAAAQARAQAQQAVNQVTAANAQLVSAQDERAQAKAQLVAIQQRITTLDGQITADQATVARLAAQIQTDQSDLAAYVRASYETGGGEATIEYLVNAQSVRKLVDRLNEVSHIADAGEILVAQISTEKHQQQQALAGALESRREAQAAQQQAATQEVIVANDEANDAELLVQDQVTANQAQAFASSAQHQATLISQYEQQFADAAAALAQARANGTIFQPVPGSLFTEDTDLTLPSGENAQTINAFLAGTALAGLGPSYMRAETTYGVSARYLVAHSIEESAWGTSAIAQGKHNLFGYGADDSNPYGDAMTFPSFDACIQFVAQTVKQSYLTPKGRFYHGPTLRGMNVDYASDPYWASKIAAIARTVPLPGS